MIILVLNCGSSSIKCKLYNMNDESELASCKIELIGTKKAKLTYSTENKTIKFTFQYHDYYSVVKEIFNCLYHQEYGVILDNIKIVAVGHRIVHGGDFFSNTVLVTKYVKKIINDAIELAPLHNPAHLSGIEAIERLLPGTPNVAVFDTAFHQTMAAEVFMYPIPKMLYTKHKIRKYGAHGTSHKYVSIKAAEFLNRKLEDLKIISCHIGNGVSITAINNGKSVDTSMGLTPLEGLMMGTRSGDIDPAVIPYVMSKENLSLKEVIKMLNTASGLIGISGFSSDMRDIEENIDNNDNCKLAIEMYEYRLRKYIGSYIAVMNGVDVIIFTAGVGENSVMLREKLIKNLNYFGAEIDIEANKLNFNHVRRISSLNSKIEILVIPTNEELMIARETLTIVKST
ncbi:MAG: acetate/propionate family kinase [Vulcanibacillus sp.]